MTEPAPDEAVPGPATVQRILKALDARWTWRHAAPGDRCGLLVGDRSAAVRHAMVCLNCRDEVITEAASRGCRLILAWTPLFDEPLTDVTSRTRSGRAVLALARHNIALICGSTAWDASPGGMSDALMDGFDCRKRRPLHPSADIARARIGVTVTAGDLDAVWRALDRAGVTEDDLTIVPVNRKVAPDATADALRLEVSVLEERRRDVMTAVIGAHPDGDRHVDHYLLGNTDKPVGLGRVGELPQRVPARQLMSDLKRLLEVSHVRVLGNLAQKVKRLAVSLAGDVSSIRQAVNYGASCLIAGDVTYDAACVANEAGLVVLDPGFVPLAWWTLRQLLPAMMEACEGVTVTTAAQDPTLFH